LWNSDDDGREEIDAEGNKESLEGHLRKRLNEELIKLNMIKV
jgi:hypothetical protein